MHILLTGANGFIGVQILTALLHAGHRVVAAVRKPDALRRQFPDVEAIACDFNVDIQPAIWLPRLADIDAVINCAGILQGSRTQNIAAVHCHAPKALFDACVIAGVRRVVQISAISADAEADTAYARSKKQADDYLRRLPLDWIVLRPSLVYAQGSYGGTSLLRGLAVLPWRIPVVGRGEQPFRPIHGHDLSAGIVALLARSDVARVTLEPAGPQVLTLAEILVKLRRWLGGNDAPLLPLPVGLIRVLTRIGEWLAVPAVNRTALQQLEYGNTGDPSAWIAATGIEPAAMDTWLQREPSQPQDRSHARMFFVRPLLRLSLVLLWILTGVLVLLWVAS